MKKADKKAHEDLECVTFAQRKGEGEVGMCMRW